ncbi:T3SS effector HopA1 family protein [Nocardiopsis potens]|uniref:T3SS effector HopA1 family protein n=1 Tax=Nocardiopsis potens TaxID=1246458 RepID=UPI00034BBDCD|nr:T3SS effector HopA1 family protein [Nocardiopsis potens]
MSAPLRALERIAEETRVLGADAVAHTELGRLPVPDGAGEAGSAERAERFLTTVLYLHYHARDRRGLVEALSGGPARGALWRGEDPGFAEKLIAGIAGEGYLVEGFGVAAVDGDRADLAGYGLRLRAHRSGLRWAGRLRAGGEAAVRFPPYRRYLQRGRLLVVGDACTGGPRPEDVVRCYLRPAADAAAGLTAGLTGELNALGARFQLKLASHPDGYERADAAVAYLPVAEWDRARGAVAAVCERFADALSGEAPCLALRVRPGWAVAVDRARPGSPSFGRGRSALVARGLVAAWRAGARTPADRLQGVLASLRAAGVDPHRPYLEPGLAPPLC